MSEDLKDVVGRGNDDPSPLAADVRERLVSVAEGWECAARLTNEIVKAFEPELAAFRSSHVGDGGVHDLRLIRAVMDERNLRDNYIKDAEAVRTLLDALSTTQAERDTARKESAELRDLLAQRTADIAKAQPDASVRRISPTALDALAASAEAQWALAETEEDRVEATALEMLVAWQRSPPAAEAEVTRLKAATHGIVFSTPECWREALEAIAESIVSPACAQIAKAALARASQLTEGK